MSKNQVPVDDSRQAGSTTAFLPQGQPLPFLKKVAASLLQQYGNKISDIHIVLPSRRSCLYMKYYLKQLHQKSFLAPEILSVEDFILGAAELEIPDHLSLLFELFNVYKQYDKDKNHNLEKFAPLGSIILKDFDMIDKNLVNGQQLFEYLSEVKAIERWGEEFGQEASQKRSDQSSISNYYAFWGYLHDTYLSLTSQLLARQQAYPGLAYRWVAGNIDRVIQNKQLEYVVFAGFNQLYASEESIITQLQERNMASLWWDMDRFYVEKPLHEAGHYFRRFVRKHQPQLLKNSEQLAQVVHEDISTAEKNIKIIGVSNKVTQGKLVGELLEKIVQELADRGQSAAFKKSVNHTAILLPDESMLLPVLYSLPIDKAQADIHLKDYLNVTMGLSMDKTPLFNLVNNLFVMQENMQTDQQGQWQVYYKDLLNILRHPFIQYSPHHETIQKILEEVQRNNQVYIPQAQLLARGEDFAALFGCWHGQVELALAAFYRIVEVLSRNLNQQYNVLESEYLFLFYTLLRRADAVLGPHKSGISTRTFRYLLYEAIANTSVPFTGEPLSPVHIMGMLESHTLDFENVIVLSCNEGILPRGKVLNSMIPFDLRLRFDLPTHVETDAAYAYTFYRLFHKAKNITLIYTTTSEGTGSAEKSRFLTQAEAEMAGLPNILLRHRQVVLSLPNKAQRSEGVEKTPAIIAALQNYLRNGITPTFVNMYIASPQQFFERKILNLKDPEEVEEMMMVNTFGTVVHSFLELSLQQYVGRSIQKKDLEAIIADDKAMQQCIEEIIRKQKGGIVIDRGRNFILKNVARYLLRSFLELQAQRETPFLMLAQEKELKSRLRLELAPGDALPVTLSGFADRIDVKDDFIRVVDYKTGYYHPPDLKAASMEELLLKPEKGKIVQLLIYKYLLIKSLQAEQGQWAGHNVSSLLDGFRVKSGFYFFKKLKDGFKGYELGDEPREDIDEFIQYVERFTNIIVKDMLDVNKPFTREASNFGISR